MYENETKEKILERLLSNVPSDVDKRQGSITYDMLSPASIELALAFIEMDNVLKFGFASTTYGNYLDLRASEVGMTRKSAVKATGQVTFSGSTEEIVVPEGTEVSTDSDDPIVFVTTADVTLPASSSATVDAEAKVGGEEGNVFANTITLVLGDYSYLSVDNAKAFSGGLDEETDEALLSRYYQQVRKPSTSGNENHYIEWATSVTGVGSAKVFPLWNGNGTVKVVIVNSDFQPASTTLVSDVQSYIDPTQDGSGQGQAPIGATVTVESATTKVIDVSATLTLEDGYTTTEAQTEIETAIDAHFEEIAFKETVVRYSKIGSIILNCDSVADYSNLTINAGTTNISLLETEIPDRGTVTV